MERVASAPAARACASATLSRRSSKSSCGAAPKSITSQVSARASIAAAPSGTASPCEDAGASRGAAEAPERGLSQLGSLGGGNHFIELQRSEESGTLFVQVHTGSRGFGHGLATNYFDHGEETSARRGPTSTSATSRPSRAHYADYLDAVAAGGNFAIVNRLVIFERWPRRSRRCSAPSSSWSTRSPTTWCRPRRTRSSARCWVHRKGATRAFPAGHPALAGPDLAGRGPPGAHPRLEPRPQLRAAPLAGAARSAYSASTTARAGACRAARPCGCSTSARSTSSTAATASW
jgi:hypothetical protein